MNAHRQSLLVILLAVVGAFAGGAMFARYDGTAASVGAAPDLALSCGAGHRAEIRQSASPGAPGLTLDCVPESTAMAADVVAPAIPARTPAPVTSTAARVAASPVAAPVRDVVARPVSYADGGISRVTSDELAASRQSVRRSSWKKRALVVGGAAGAGAGIGAIAGGKKGALIGAAVGGGGAAILDALRHH